ncbi:MAG: acyl-CoA dehydrogenase [Lysobacterales bacterium]|jgi:alkylation response protein AidB-like acyl-CoA dehydrogenase
MALVLNEEQSMLRESARDFLAGRAPISHLRDLRDSGNNDRFSRELWNEMAEMGWTAMLVPEEYGGHGYGFTGMGIVLEETGRTLTPSPLLSTAMTAAAAVTLAGTPGQRSDLLPGIATGERIVALACDETSLHAPGEIEAELDASGGGYRLNGNKTAVVDGHIADTLIVSAEGDRGISLLLVPSNAAGVSVERYPLLDTHAAARVSFDGVRLDDANILGTPGRGLELLDEILDIARIGASAELLGIAQEAFERTVQYLKDRKQFGVPIGSFQALQHRAARLFGEIELGKSVVLRALHALDEGSAERAELASLAKARVSATAHLATTEAIQMHGGIGMTDDFDIGFFLKRWKILDSLYGDRNFHLDRFARLRGY